MFARTPRRAHTPADSCRAARDSRRRHSASSQAQAAAVAHERHRVNVAVLEFAAGEWLAVEEQGAVVATRRDVERAARDARHVPARHRIARGFTGQGLPSGHVLVLDVVAAGDDAGLEGAVARLSQRDAVGAARDDEVDPRVLELARGRDRAVQEERPRRPPPRARRSRAGAPFTTSRDSTKPSRLRGTAASRHPAERAS